MIKPSSKTKKVLAVIVLTALIFLAFSLSAFTISTITPDENLYLAIPNPGEETPADQVNLIKNGGFEERDSDPLNGVAIDWEPYTNGKATFGFYDETWPEAVFNGGHAQLMEIAFVEASVLDRVIAVHQTVDVNPNSQYELTVFAIMRSQAPAIDRNKSEFEMHWGVDFFGEGNYDNVEQWHLMPLTEQYRLGSSGEFPDDVPLAYEIITGTVFTTDTNKITLFIRGLKKFSTGTEVNFDIDDVSLVGPPAGSGQPASTPTPETSATPSPEENNLPTSGAILPKNLSVGALALGGLVLIVLGASAAASLLYHRQET
jgi:hypothetical protein